MKGFAYGILIFFFASISLNAQNKVDFGVKGGLNYTFFKIKESSFGFDQDTESGFYGGLFFDFKIDESYGLQPELLFITLKDFKFLNVPLYVRYEVANRVNLLVGPSVNYFFDFFSNKLKIRADLSSSYTITSSLDIQVKYALGFQEITPNSFFIGLGVRL
ncbi:outer membrane beta-barrel protein [Seonamhaeicola aphaedonensis]|uniref:Outer membrane protein with beta-barrel domain n=1 Tax=Seonamhaeicola aphaedonensis TaxID=1461338 RepID=A0A3D9HJJ6_9FLAO|nr:outer membrane beta-barrel protein [Seonamhaeicola aphaedonensis]RED49605.1 outer membrane protein with beta-barrel domain [Seonamhaeicola aphaedonensis]